MDQTCDSFSWHAHPAVERRGAALRAAGVILIFAATIAWSFQSAAWGIFSLVALVAALHRFFFPSRFTIDAEGITARYPLRTLHLDWSAVRRLVTDGRGAYLSTRRRRSWLDGYRGMHVLFGRDRAAVVARLKARLEGSDHP